MITQNWAAYYALGQGRPTRSPPKVSKWPAKGFNIDWLIDPDALTRYYELHKRVLKLLFDLRSGEHHKIHRNWWTENLFFGLQLLFGKRNRFNLNGDLFVY